MSKPRYGWWSYVKAIVRRYPEMALEYARATELPVRPSTRRREYEAVRRAVEITGGYRDGADRLRMVELAFWGTATTLGRVAQELGCPRKIVEESCAEFIRLVALCYGLMD